MKLAAIFFATLLFFGVQNTKAQDMMEVTPADSEQVAQQLEFESRKQQHTKRTREILSKIARLFRQSDTSIEVEVNKKSEDCANCKRQRANDFFTKLGRDLGKGAARVSATTAKPFMTVSAFFKGSLENGEKNKELLGLFHFFLNNQEEFKDLYLDAGTPAEMVELMLAKMEEITKKKERLILGDFLTSLGLDLPEDLSDFELSTEDISKIDESKLDPDLINNHPEYQELRPILGDVSKEDLRDILESGYFSKRISFENYKDGLPGISELVGTIVGQLAVPKLALGIVSNTLSGLYLIPVAAADVGTGVSTAICLRPETIARFEDDGDLRLFCSYVINRSGYMLLQGRAKGYVAGKNFHLKVSNRLNKFMEKQENRKRKKEEEKNERGLGKPKFALNSRHWGPDNRGFFLNRGGAR